jgi:outer membrane protein assembly factor BamB
MSGYSAYTGNKIWGPIALPNASPFDSLGVSETIANGTIYLWGYGGDVYSYNILTGALNWQYHTPPGGYESPYGVEPIWTFTVGTIAGGELFLPEGHMYSPPLFHGAQQLALNITNGKVVWSIDAFDVTSAPAVSDGIATTLNAYDNQIYAYGMGPTRTTVTAPDIGVTTATPVTITGTVTDISAGSQQNAVAMNFPNGLPCVSDASMSAFMEAVYEQQPMPTNIIGVPVTLTETDHNGNTYTIGTTTSDSSGTFAYTWTPPIEGNYTIAATFAGSNAYYGSCAETHIYASAPAPTAAPTASPPTGLATSSELTYGIIAVIIVIIVAIAIVALLLLRKKP